MNSIVTIDNFPVPPLIAVEVYSPPQGTKSIFQRLIATSQDPAAIHFLTLYKVPPGGGPGALNIIVENMAIAPATGSGGTDISLMINQTLEAGYSLWAVLDSLAIVLLNGSLVEVS